MNKKDSTHTSRAWGGDRVSSRALAAAAAVLILPLVLTACTSPSAPSPTRSTVDFAVGATDDGLVVITAAGDIAPVIVDDADFEPDATTAAAAGSEAVAVLTDGVIYSVASDGSTTSAPCAVCSGVAQLGDGFITAQRSFLPGVDFELVTFDAELQEEGRSRVEFSPSRLAPSVTSRMRFPKVEATLPDGTVVVTYVSAAGGEAGNGRIYGPWVVAYYASTGTLLRWLEGPGHNSIGPVSVSPDGRFSAVDGGSVSGACDLWTWTELIDNEAARLVSLDASPSLDGGQQPDGVVAGRWVGNHYLNVRTTRPDTADSCADLRTTWEEDIDPVDGSISSRVLGGVPYPIGYLGDSCDAPLTSNDNHELAAADKPLPSVTRIVFAPQRQECSG